MHDLRALEGYGAVAVGVATSEFVDAAAVQNRYLGYDAAVVFVAHPIQDRTTAELHRLADDAFEAIVAALTAPA